MFCVRFIGLVLFTKAQTISARTPHHPLLFAPTEAPQPFAKRNPYSSFFAKTNCNTTPAVNRNGVYTAPVSYGARVAFPAGMYACLFTYTHVIAHSFNLKPIKSATKQR